MRVFEVKFIFYVANMAWAKGHSSKTKSQVSDIRTIGPLVFLSFLFVCLLINDINPFRIRMALLGRSHT